ncbi:ATP-grasp domain-containing protein [Streptomyces sp. RB6PN25]|uniref:ATP-grasp domain-containing protein n=1 Tax=Streptomyces humicola TaxID=2953240 RepID=A0ABT1PTU4_9ACTN|nr:ATP-grasp domain-containing protein [Streptomyces humicola]MCQ4081084.1 ATP-grasp domain-containing protein [Streptomyces humicola]
MPDHVIVIHRWTDRYADYAAYIDHTAHRVSYITTDTAAALLPQEHTAGIRLVPSTQDAKAVRQAVDDLVEQSGPPTRIIALQELDLDLAADLRGDFGLPGLSTEDLAPLRDKLLMARRLEAAGVPAPATADAPDHAAVEAFAGRNGWPVLVKPRYGTASSGITRLDSRQELAAYAFPQDTLLVQPWVPDGVLHVDGIVTEAGLGAWRASRYLNTCLDFTAGAALGSVEIDDEETLARIGEITDATTRALFTQASVFHLELFASDQGDLTVLEIAARPGGAEVPFIWREVHGIDLMATAFAHQMGLPDDQVPQADGASHVGGWLLVPPSVPMPCRVRSVTSHTGEVDGPYAEVLPDVGRLMDRSGYEHAGARFRFRGAATTQVEEAIRRTMRSAVLECTPVDRTAPPRLVLIGCGNPPYRRYSLSTAANRVQTALVQRTATDWQRQYVDDRFRTADTCDVAQTTCAVAQLLDGHEGPGAVLTWDETLLETTAQVARRLGLAHMSPQAARRCRDKLATRRLLDAAGVPSAGFRHVHTHAEALQAAEQLGYPVVVKPRALAGSIGVTLAADEDELVRAVDQATGSTFPGISSLSGVIVEEFLRGPEISVDSAVLDGEVRIVNVAHKRLGFAPYFEEIGHLVAPWRHQPWADELRSVVTSAHRTLGIRTGLTHAELRLTSVGPRIVEVNGRLGGDFIPLLGTLATGVDPVAAAIDIALDTAPDTERTRDRCAEVRFVYPEHDAAVRSLDLTAAQAVPGIVQAIPLAGPGTELRLPPHGIVPRLAALLATADTPEECATTLRRAEEAVRAQLVPLPPLHRP